MATTAKLRDVCTRITSGGTPSRKRSEYFASAGMAGHLWVKSKELLDCSLDSTEECISDLGLNNSSAKYLPANTVLVAMYGVNVGQLAWLRCPATVNQAICGLVVDPRRADYRYVFYALKETRAQLIAQAQGAAQQNLNQDKIKDFVIPLPPLAEQRRIASILSAYDDLIENNTRRIAILEEMARRIYEEWFVHFRFPGHEHVRMVESELGPVPEGWDVTSLGDVAENHDRRRKPLSKMQRETFKGPYPYYGAAKVFDYVREYIFDGQFLLLAEDGSVETPDGFPVLQLTDGKFWPNNHTHILCGTDKASTEFLYLKLERLPIRGYITGAAQPKLTQANINRIPVLLPTAKLMAEFTALIRPFFQLRASLLRASSTLRTTRDLLLPKLISGELDVSALPEPEAAAA